MSFTEEQEAQLTAWGCPARDRVGEFGPPSEKFWPRQPHDVLAWLNDGIDPPDPALLAVAMLCTASNGARASVFDGNMADPYTLRVRPNFDFKRDDPYAATFALAQSVMEAA